MTDAPSLRLLRRLDCGLCDEAEAELRRLGVPYEPVDIDSDALLRQRYGEAIPVLLYGERELTRAPISLTGLRAALARSGLFQSRTGRYA